MNRGKQLHRTSETLQKGKTPKSKNSKQVYKTHYQLLKQNILTCYINLKKRKVSLN